MKRKRTKLLIAAGAVAIALAGFSFWMGRALQPTKPGELTYFRFNHPTRLSPVIDMLARWGILRNAFAIRLYAWTHRQPETLATGTYAVRSGMTAGQLLWALASPVRQLVRLPETNWSKRDAGILQRDLVTSASSYLQDVADPSKFQKYATFPLPKHSLEGYLFPDTYDLPPLLGADAVVIRQLHAFERKVWEPLGRPKNLRQILTIASLVELEAGTDADRPMIAGVIQNRLAKHMPLQIDASILYGIGKWRRLTFKDYKDIHSPYNLYLHKGLPPTPICSPSLKSIEAAMHPAHHNFYYYVALPNGKSLFSTTYAEHKKKIKLRLLALKQLADLRADAGSPTTR